MALVEGTNCGFVTTAPTENPGGDEHIIDYRSISGKFTSPAGAIRVVEIGWWCDNATQASNFEVGIYAHDSGNDKPGAVVGSLSQTNAKGTGLGWKSATGLSIPISAETVYWLGVQLDDTSTPTNLDYSWPAGSRASMITPTTTLADPWGLGTEFIYLMSIYAVWETATGMNVKINIGDVWKDVDSMKINIGDAWKTI